MLSHLVHWKRLWCWEGLGAGGEGDDSGWDDWMASPIQRMWVCMNSGSWWWTGGLECCNSWGRRVGHDWATELNWTEPGWDSVAQSPIVLLWLSELCRIEHRHTWTHTHTQTHKRQWAFKSPLLLLFKCLHAQGSECGFLLPALSYLTATSLPAWSVPPSSSVTPILSSQAVSCHVSSLQPQSSDFSIQMLSLLALTLHSITCDEASGGSVDSISIFPKLVTWPRTEKDW